MSWDIYGNPLRRGYCEVHPDVHEEYPCRYCMAEKQQHSQPHDELEQLKHDFAQQGDYIRKLEADIHGFGQKLRSAQHEVEALQRQDAVHAEVVNILTEERDFLLTKLDENEAQKNRIAELEREKAELMARFSGLNKLHSDLTNADMVCDEDENQIGYVIENEQIDEMEHLLSVDAQCLNQIKAEAVVDSVKFFHPARDIDVEALESYAAAIAKGNAE